MILQKEKQSSWEEKSIHVNMLTMLLLFKRYYIIIIEKL
jgi:hypothetical protein